MAWREGSISSPADESLRGMPIPFFLFPHALFAFPSLVSASVSLSPSRTPKLAMDFRRQGAEFFGLQMPVAKGF